MKMLFLLVAAILGGASTLNSAAGAEPQSRVPVLLELFTSEGCSSCPPADSLLAGLDQKQPIGGADLIVLSEHVDYWNQLSWGDPYSSALFSDRQREYSAYLKSGDIYTPQLVVDGRWQIVGSRQREVASAIGKSILQPKLPVQFEATRSGTDAQLKLHIDPNAHGEKNAAVFCVLAADRVQNHVPHGENAGRELSHVAVVYSFTKIGTLKGGDSFEKQWSVSLKPKFAALGGTRLIIIVQDRTTGRVVGLAQSHL